MGFLSICKVLLFSFCTLTTIFASYSKALYLDPQSGDVAWASSVATLGYAIYESVAWSTYVPVSLDQAMIFYFIFGACRRLLATWDVPSANRIKSFHWFTVWTKIFTVRRLVSPDRGIVPYCLTITSNCSAILRTFQSIYLYNCWWFLLLIILVLSVLLANTQTNIVWKYVLCQLL